MCIIFVSCGAVVRALAQIDALFSQAQALMHSSMEGQEGAQEKELEGSRQQLLLAVQNAEARLEAIEVRAELMCCLNSLQALSVKAVTAAKLNASLQTQPCLSWVSTGPCLAVH